MRVSMTKIMSRRSLKSKFSPLLYTYDWDRLKISLPHFYRFIGHIYSNYGASISLMATTYRLGS